MNWLAWLRLRRAEAPAETARERLKFLLAHERLDRATPDYLPPLKREILEVLAKYIQVGGDEVEVRLARGLDATVLEVSVTIPAPQPAPPAVPLGRIEPAFAR